MVHHYPVPDLDLAHALAHFGDDPAGLMAPGSQVAQVVEGTAVPSQVAAAEARRFHFDNDLAGPGRRVRQLPYLHLSVSEKYDASHGNLL
jgi:hypothetical protein